MTIEYHNDLINGNIGTVREESDWDEDNDCIVINNQKYETCDEVSDIDTFLNKPNINPKNLILFKGYGYYYDLCCSGYYIDNDGNEYTLDIINDYMVYIIRKI